MSEDRQVGGGYASAQLATVVVRKGNAILYAGFATVKKLGRRADSAARARKTMERTLSRLG